MDMRASDGVLKVKSGMGLEYIGSKSASRIAGISKYQAAVAIYRRNSKMFSNKAPVYPFQGMTLVIPTKEQMALEKDSTYFDILMRGEGVISVDRLPKLNPSGELSEKERQELEAQYNQKLQKVLDERRAYLQAK